MNRSLPRLALAAAALVLLASGPARAADLIDNPEYQMWAKFKPGTSVTHKNTGVIKGKPSNATVTTTLKEIDADKLVIEPVAVVEIDGMQGATMKMGLPKRTIPAKIAKPAGDSPYEKAKAQAKSGDEDIEVDGKKFHCHWIEVTWKVGNDESYEKTWTCPDIPGQLVKQDTWTKGDHPAEAHSIVDKYEIAK